MRYILKLYSGTQSGTVVSAKILWKYVENPPMMKHTELDRNETRRINGIVFIRNWQEYLIFQR